MLTVEREFVLLGLTTAAGAVIGLLHDCWLVFVLGHNPAVGGRRQVLRSPYLLPIWLAAVALAWAVLYVASWGTVRGFVMLGFALGAVLYYVLISRLIRRMLSWNRWAVKTVVRIILDALAWCVLLPWRIVCWLGRPIVGVLTVILAVPGRLLLSGAEGAGVLASTATKGVGDAVRRLWRSGRPPGDGEPPEVE